MGDLESDSGKKRLSAFSTRYARMKKSSLGQKLVKVAGGVKRVKQDGVGAGPVADEVVDIVDEGFGLENRRRSVRVSARAQCWSLKLTLTQMMALIRAAHCLLVPAPTTRRMVTGVLARSIDDSAQCRIYTLRVEKQQDRLCSFCNASVCCSLLESSESREGLTVQRVCSRSSKLWLGF